MNNYSTGTDARRKPEPLPDLRFLKTSDLASLEDPQNQEHLVRLKCAHAWHQKLARDMKRRAELSQDIAEGCKNVLCIVEAMTGIRAGPHRTKTAIQGPTEESMDLSIEVQQNDYPSSDQLSRQSRDEFPLHDCFDQSLRLHAEHHSNCDMSKYCTEQTRPKQFDRGVDTANKTQPHRRDNSEDSSRVDFFDNTAENDRQYSAADIVALEHQANEAIKCLNILRAQWQVGGRNFESWAGSSHKQSKHAFGTRYM